MRGRPRRLVAWTAAGVGLAAGAWAAWLLNLVDLERSLVREANEVLGAERARPSHVDHPAPGSFSDALRSVLPAYEAGVRPLLDLPEATSLMREVADGSRPPSDLPPPLRAGLASLESRLDPLLAASHAESPGLGPDHDPFAPYRGASWTAFQAAARHAGIRIWETPPAGRGIHVAACLDGLALGRDAAVSGGLIGRMVNTGVVRSLTAGCAEVLAALPPEEALRAAGRIRVVRDAVPPFASMLREEAVAVQLLAYGLHLSAADRAALADRPRAFAFDGSMAPEGIAARLRSQLGWRPLRAYLDDAVERARLPALRRVAALEELPAAHPFVAWLFGLEDSPDPGLADQGPAYARYCRLDLGARLRLDLLVGVAAARTFRAREGRWPRDTVELSGDLQPDEASQLRALAFTEEDGDELLLRLAVPAAEAGEEVAVEVRARR